MLQFNRNSIGVFKLNVNDKLVARLGENLLIFGNHVSVATKECSHLMFGVVFLFVLKINDGYILVFY